MLFILEQPFFVVGAIYFGATSVTSCSSIASICATSLPQLVLFILFMHFSLLVSSILIMF
ncbi:hypothetical protein C2G38_2064642 [Gigaspora rosea]|uniref:Uncharacterized protein n=1 Tax=Gigaspora rosea TaxID=44941 RepID=A0A397W561_9GLOM|nr:hypothetical protein C2G38_2064642 [Gigaspora rosea]